MARKFEPLLSAKVFSNKPGVTEKNLTLLKFPLRGSIKYDGWRVVEYDGRAVLRSLKSVRNMHASALLARLFARCAELGYRGLDGEVVVGPANHPNSMQHTTSGLSTITGQPEFTFFLFDTYQNAEQPYTQRYARLRELMPLIAEEFPWVQLVQQKVLHNMAEMLAYEAEIVALGYEGIMLRAPQGHYKMGRSTMLEGLLAALKRFMDDEAIVLAYRAEQENANEAGVNELGRTHRTSHASGMIPKDRMGTMLCASLNFSQTFGLGGGVGITHEVRKHVWENPHLYQWRVAKYAYQDIGIRERPRIPRWKGWRAWEDMDVHTARRLLRLAESYQHDGNGLFALQPEYKPSI